MRSQLKQDCVGRFQLSLIHYGIIDGGLDVRRQQRYLKWQRLSAEEKAAHFSQKHRQFNESLLPQSRQQSNKLSGNAPSSRIGLFNSRENYSNGNARVVEAVEVVSGLVN
jgi:hypothetical protein